ADVAIAAAPADVACDREFVVGVGAEQRSLDARTAGAAPLRAELDIAAGRGRQVEGEAGAAVGAIAQFVEGRRLEAATRGCVEPPVARRRERQAEHRRG